MFDKKKKIALVCLAGVMLFALAFYLFYARGKSSMGDHRAIKQSIFSATKVKNGDSFDLKVLLNTGNEEVGAFVYDFSYDPEDIVVDIEKGDKGISKGIDAGSFILMSNPDSAAEGFFKFSGICAQSCGSGDSRNVAVIHLRAQKNLKTKNLNFALSLKELANVLGASILPQGI